MVQSKSEHDIPSNASSVASSKSSESIAPPAFKPKPIIGPDGREIPRPKDAEGRPLPIYSTADGKPYLDKEGRPIPLMFDENGKPLPPPPLEPPTPPVVVPNCVVGVGIVDIFICMIVAGVAGFALTKGPTDSVQICLILTLALEAVGALADLCPFLAMKKKSKVYLYAWIGVGFLLLACQAGLTIVSHPPEAVGASIHCLVRAVFICLIYCGVYACDNSNKVGAEDNRQRHVPMLYYQPLPARRYSDNPRPQQTYQSASPSPVVVQQPPPQVIVQQQPPPVYVQQQQPQTVVVAAQPQPAYGYGYPGLGYGYGGVGYPPYGGHGGLYGGDLAMLAMMEMSHHDYHHHHHFPHFHDHFHGFDGGFFM